MSKLLKPEKYPAREFGRVDFGPCYCPECGAVHHDKRWSFDSSALAEMKHAGVTPHVCPACTMVSQGLFEGELMLRWSRFAVDGVQKGDVLNLIHHVAEMEKIKHPLSRLVSLQEDAEAIIVLTTTPFLATRLGHAVHRAFEGELSIDKLEREAFTRVDWHRHD